MPSRNYFESLSSQDAAVELSGQLKVIAVSVMKMANDLRWMNSGPLAGLGEIALPALQPGSSIMPGKVNPVIPEAAAMVAAEVIGNDAAITVGGQSGNFQLNVMLPLIAYNLLESIRLLSNVLQALADRALAGFTVNEARLQEALERNPILVTALNSIIGYEKGAAIAKKAYAQGVPIREMAQQMTDLQPAELAQAPRPPGADPRGHQGRHQRRRVNADPQFWQRRIAERLRGSTARHERADWVLPGLTAEVSRTFERFLPEKLVPAAVLMPIILRDPAATVLFTQRASALTHHAGQISFPGGRLEASDASPIAAALREAHEEVGLDPAFVTVVGFLPDHIIGTGFRVTPVVAFVRPGFTLRPDAREVQETFEVPLDYLFEPANFRPRMRQYVPDLPAVQLNDIPVGERNIWGATAGMLMSLYRLCKE